MMCLHIMPWEAMKGMYGWYMDVSILEQNHPQQIDVW